MNRIVKQPQNNKIMKTIKKKIFVTCLVLLSISLNAQQIPMFTHYMNNTLMVNPAYAGSRDALSITTLHRSQWVGFNDAPMTQTLSMHTPLRNERIGIGLSILNDKIGPTNNTSIFFNYAYIMKLSEKSKLSLGMSVGGSMFQANLNSINLDQQNDPAFQNNINNHLSPNFGFGVYYSREKFYAGLSTPMLLQNSYSGALDGNNVLVGKDQRHYFFIAGALINLSPDIAFKPTTLVKVTAVAPAQIDLTTSFIFMEKFLVGAMFRSGDAFGGLVGFNFSEQLHFGYSYDWSYGLKTAKYNQGSHEIMLRYDFIFSNKKQIHSPRYF
jgi:type IX secretion system PorP/SprF family membrane protein